MATKSTIKELPRYSIGLGDRSGLQGISLLKAVAAANEEYPTAPFCPVFNKSVREDSAVGTGPKDTRRVTDAAVKKFPWKEAYFVDADHVSLENVEAYIPYCDYFTIDVTSSIGKTDAAKAEAFVKENAAEAEAGIHLPEFATPLVLKKAQLEQFAKQYVSAAAAAGEVYRRIAAGRPGKPFAVEVSLDEVQHPQTAAELYYFAKLLAAEKVPVQAIAPKFSGSFHKGVDFKGDVAAFEAEFEASARALLAAAARFNLPHGLKLSVHAGSDKFSLYPAMGRALARSRCGVHLKTAGTTWLEQLVGLAVSGDADALAFVRELYAWALEHREEIVAPYAASLDLSGAKLPTAAEVAAWDGERLAKAIEHDEACPEYSAAVRQLLHVAYKGALAGPKGCKFAELVERCRDTVDAHVTENIHLRHLVPILAALTAPSAEDVAAMKKYKFWFITGTQSLYGPEVIKQVGRDSEQIVAALNKNPSVVGEIVFKGAVLDSKCILDVVMAANNAEDCAGVITWMHTFSPSKMWIPGLTRLQKPLLHLNTQLYRDIPWGSIDMDYMNLHQSAHGDREHGYIGARLRLPRKVIAGHWADPRVAERIGHWMRSAAGVFESRRLRVCRFGDNMREVAVTEGDKVEAEIRMGWSVNGWGVGDLVKVVDKVTEAEIDAKMADYAKHYDLSKCADRVETVRYQARMQVALERFLSEGGFGGFADTFQDLNGLRQLPGLAVQDMMRKGFGFGAEGDWKMACLTRIMKMMARGLPGGSAFMEDYSYHMDPANQGILGAHMLEVDPVLAADRPWVEVHPLGIGDREDPARLCFNTGPGKAIVATLVDMGDRFRMIVNDVRASAPFEDMPRLPTARVMWKPLPDLATSAEAWILAGGAHHTVLSYQLDAEHMRDFCNILGIEFVHIGEHTDIAQLEKELAMNDALWKLK